MFEMVSRMPMFRGKIIAGFLAVACIFAAAAMSSAAARADAALFGQSCGKCHARASTLARALKGDTPAEKAAALDTFLAKHHAEDAVTRARIVAYLAGLAAK